MELLKTVVIIVILLYVIYWVWQRVTGIKFVPKMGEKKVVNKVRRDAAEERKVQNFRKNVFTTEVMGVSRRFFFDAKESLDGKKFLTISELEKEIGGDKAYTIIIFADEIEGFKKAVERSYGFVKNI